MKVGTIDVNAAMVESGQAYDSKSFSRGAYAADETVARSKSLGVWKDPGSVKPWDWRHQKRNAGK